jgi:hypothetical protein
MKKKQRTKTIEDERNKIEKPEKKKTEETRTKKTKKKKKFVSLHREGKRNRNGGHHLLPTAT